MAGKETHIEIVFTDNILLTCPMPIPHGKAEESVLHKLKELRDEANRLWGIDVRPEVSFDLRGQAAGQANYHANRLRFNLELLRKYGNDFVEQTVPHEFAHLVSYRKFGRRIKPHGIEWKSVMIELGASPSRTHRFESSPARRLKRFQYQCNCEGSSYELTSVRHNRIQRGHTYICRKCRAALFLKKCK